ncbi:hypothetical protein ALI144C_24185 [Actinosynnema sp. ALI-1.44]|uniref:cysteine peptidase family C39 domain-containing protein n=1 Tax=Actinosynnema sp. ALI-1.44 TaxID=1933779 RepID=UPI00097CA9E3|nr:cysteine peptidase family C39 domain-containing protein [Actinosynnema sp. ALI-1.44]ONI79834.1 hypothetical protein ALI144C_24185 [Actinosynnema sp. ALI-1.44]
MTAYIGSGPYCYSNSVAMLTGATPAVVETLTGSPFGAQIEGALPYFDPCGWHPEIGVDNALSLLGWRCERETGGDPVARLRALDSPAMAGPLDMGLLSYQTAGAGDHYVVVLEVTDDVVLLHDPESHPYATLPIAQFVAAWEGKAVTYSTESFVLRSKFVRDRAVSEVDALWASVPQAIRWLDGASDAVLEMASRSFDADTRTLWAHFGIRVGTRRLADASANLAALGLTESARVLDEQARLVGGLQYPLLNDDDLAVADGLRRLSPTYNRLRDVLEAEYVRVRG